jgi:hypothetical protein
MAGSRVVAGVAHDQELIGGSQAESCVTLGWYGRRRPRTVEARYPASRDYRRTPKAIGYPSDALPAYGCWRIASSPAGYGMSKPFWDAA